MRVGRSWGIVSFLYFEDELSFLFTFLPVEGETGRQVFRGKSNLDFCPSEIESDRRVRRKSYTFLFPSLPRSI